MDWLSDNTNGGAPSRAEPAQDGAAGAWRVRHWVRMHEQLLMLREGRVRRREQAVQAREEDASEREDAATERETNASVLESSVSSRELQLNETAQDAAEQSDAQLKMVNEQLVISSIQLQIANEEIEQSKNEMRHLAQHDYLTDLPNRLQLYDRIAQAILQSKRHHNRLAVLFLDLDRFKLINDSFGHAIGDKLLQTVAQRLASVVRSSDTVSRQGGDEFVLLLSDVNQSDQLASKIDSIHDIVTAPYCIEGRHLNIGATIGISVFPDDGDDTETLLRNADAAMYAAKENGRNRYQFFKPEMHALNLERQNIEVSLIHALAQHQFVLYYQAQVGLASGSITGAEALIRWNHPSKGIMPPAQFIQIAEESGAIVPIGQWVLREACRQMQAWLQAGLELDVVAVNISAREFESDEFLPHVRAVLQETGLDPTRLELELTETVLMKSFEHTKTTLIELRAMSVRISIDDFGTGYSSLSYLKRFPVDTLKIDQSFVRDISTNTGSDDILLSAIIGIGNILQHYVVAEGVENPVQLEFLKKNRCTAAQGFYLNVPMSGADFAVVLQQGLASELVLH
jgi:diguanylate cyclase (GGDEF)-like protein